MTVVLDLDGVLTEHPRVLAQAASERFGIDLRRMGRDVHRHFTCHDTACFPLGDEAPDRPGPSSSFGPCPTTAT